MNLPIVINPLAEGDLAEARAWYEAQRQGFGEEFLLSVQEALDNIQRTPGIHARIFQEIRRVSVRRFPYGIFYRMDEDQITVVAVLSRAT